ncbi:MAG: tripartite tricarboxylate transporter substrate binding protein [Spirochaetes bacterium]|nr:tripartite tricarboxylate transporter substrate binding protein [Spirochaetota bacterium]
MKKIAFLALVCFLMASTALFAAGRRDREFPSRTITIICPFAAGGGTDAIARAIAAVAEAELGVSIVVDNRTGGAGAIGHTAIMHAPADGYTLGIITWELNSLPHMGLIPFTFEDMDPFLLLNSEAAALTVHANSPFQTVADFVEHALANPGSLSVGNSGTGAVWHVAAGLLEVETGIQLTHVGFDGAAPAVTSLAGGHIDAVTVSLAEVRAQVDAGNVRVLGIMDTQRSSMSPEIPTFIEQGFNVVTSTWRGLALPRGVDPEVRQALVNAFTAAMNNPAFATHMANLNLELTPMAATEFVTFLRGNKDGIGITMNALGLTN